ncbi:MAG: hypothetical protein EPO37_05635 [Nitrosarchaeum sp.]|nr:MAG: hypothetical protein EPO37_05635 [Nitrosarchaeum sp.]
MRISKCKCVCSFGIIGMILCTTLIGFSTVGMTDATISNVELSNMNTMYDNSDNFVDKIMKFFDGTTGMTILLVSFASMLVGMWYRKKTRLIPVAAIGAVFMFAGMYHTHTLWLQILGTIIMACTYLPMYSFRVSKTLRV